jgi:DNA-binding transcriptional regulator YiaG
MSGKSAATLTARQTSLSGRVAGAVFATVRRQLGRTQEQLAEHLQVSPDTLQGWESGRKPQVNLAFSRLRQLRRALAALGSSPHQLLLWDTALHVDAILADLGQDDPRQHPLALLVPDRTTSELLAWPLTGDPPRQLRGTGARLIVPRGEQDAVAADLREVADRAGHGTVEAGMIRRQVKFLVAGNPASHEWVDQQERHDARHIRDLSDWSPDWAVMRSAAVSAAHTGDTGLLARFIDEGLANEATIAANLSYWAYWVGESPTEWDSDLAMNTGSTSWSGDQLLDSLLGGVVDAPYRDLCAVTLWALLGSRRRLAADPKRQRQIATAVSTALDSHQFSLHARQRLEQVHYLVGSE